MTAAQPALRARLRAGGLLVSSALAHSPFDGWGRRVPTLRHIRYLPELEPFVLDFGRTALRSDATLDTAVFLGADDRDLQTHPGAFSQGLAHAPTQQFRKQRRLDALFGPKVSAGGRVDALFVGESGARALAILQGAGDVLQTWRPLLVLPADGIAQVGALLQEQRYRTLDQDPARAEAARPWALAVPAEEANTWDPVSRAALEDDATTATLTVPIDAELARWGFHPPEDDGSATWIGPRPRAGLLLPASHGALESVQLDVTATSSLRNTVEAVASIDDRPAEVQPRRLDGNRVALFIRPPARLAWRPFHRLELSFPESLRSDQDTRHRALAVASITLRYACR